MTNFDFLSKDKQFEGFAQSAIASELLLHIDEPACVLSCRRCMENAIKWMYNVDESLNVYKREGGLSDLISNPHFVGIVGEDIYLRLNFIRRIGNIAAHTEFDITPKQAEISIENLFVFMDFIAYCYSEKYVENEFDPSLLALTTEEALSFVTEETIDLKNIIADKSLTQRRKEKSETYTTKPLKQTNFDVRREYVEAMLLETGWKENVTFKRDVKIKKTVIDYVLYDNSGKPVGIIEMRHTCSGIKNGIKKAQEYRKLVYAIYGKNVAFFVTDGFFVQVDNTKSALYKAFTIPSPQELGVN